MPAKQRKWEWWVLNRIRQVLENPLVLLIVKFDQIDDGVQSFRRQPSVVLLSERDRRMSQQFANSINRRSISYQPGRETASEIVPVESFFP